MRDLDVLYQKYQVMNNTNKIPIYNVQKNLFNIPDAPFPWWKPTGTLAQLSSCPSLPQFSSPSISERSNNILSLLHLQDFVSDQKSQRSILQEWKKMEEGKKKSAGGKKETRRGRDSVQKMKERREIRKYKQFLLREIERKGETHYYLMKKEVSEPANTGEVEDIFADWNKNFAELKTKIHQTEGQEDFPPSREEGDAEGGAEERFPGTSDLLPNVA